MFRSLYTFLVDTCFLTLKVRQCGLINGGSGNHQLRLLALYAAVLSVGCQWVRCCAIRGCRWVRRRTFRGVPDCTGSYHWGVPDGTPPYHPGVPVGTEPCSPGVPVGTAAYHSGVPVSTPPYSTGGAWLRSCALQEVLAWVRRHALCPTRQLCTGASISWVMDTGDYLRLGDEP